MRKGLLNSAARGRHLFLDDGARVGLTFDHMTIDSTGAFLQGELERLDPTIHDPLVDISWSRDIMLREDVTMGDEQSSFTISSVAATGSLGQSGKAWAAKNSTAVPGPLLDIGKNISPLLLWAMEVSWTIPELESAMKLNRPIDQQKHDALKLKHQMDVDEQVYVGDTLTGARGILNLVPVVASNVANGALASPLWTQKTPQEILADVNTLLNRVWAQSGWKVMPSKLLLPPTQFSFLVSRIVSDAGNMSIMQFLKENSLCKAANGRELDIQPVKWATGAGAGGTNRMLAYTNEKERVRFPMVPLQRTPIEYRGLAQLTTYFGRLGQVETPYPETLGYADGI